MGSRSAWVVVLLVCLVAACGADSGSARSSETGSETTPSESTSQSASPSETSAPWTTPTGSLRRCGPQPPSVTEFAGYRRLSLRDPAAGRIDAVRAGRGRTVVILLHQTDRGGVCGWLPFARTLAEQPDTAALAIGLCADSDSRCVAGAAQTEPLRLAVDYARDAMNARRVVVLGASMGGSVALIGGATLDGIDSVIDLSGPVTWEGMGRVRGGRALRVPALVSMADTESDEDVEGSRAIVRNAPRGSEFLPAASGHGYDLVLDDEGNPAGLADEVLAWVSG